MNDGPFTIIFEKLGDELDTGEEAAIEIDLITEEYRIELDEIDELRRLSIETRTPDQTYWTRT